MVSRRRGGRGDGLARGRLDALLLTRSFCPVDLGLQHHLAVEEVEVELGLVEAPGFPQTVIAANVPKRLGDQLENREGFFVEV